jgi:hypothetical protein
MLAAICSSCRPAPSSSVLLHSGIDVPELRIPVGMVFPFFGLAVALQTVALIAQDLGYFAMADGMPAPGQGIGNGACALARPTQRRFRIASRLGIVPDGQGRKLRLFDTFINVRLLSALLLG